MEGPDPRNLIVNYIPTPITDADLRALFEPYGEIETARVIVDKNTGHPKGYGFVKFAQEECAQKAMAEMNGHTVQNKRLKVTPAKGPTASLGHTTSPSPAPVPTAPAPISTQQQPNMVPMHTHPMGMGMNMGGMGMMGMMNPLSMGMPAGMPMAHQIQMQPMTALNPAQKPQPQQQQQQQHMMQQMYNAHQFMPAMNGLGPQMMMAGYPSMMPGGFQGFVPMAGMGMGGMGMGMGMGMPGLGMAPMMTQSAPFATAQPMQQPMIVESNQLPSFPMPMLNRDVNPATNTGIGSFGGTLLGLSSGMGSTTISPTTSLDAKSPGLTR